MENYAKEPYQSTRKHFLIQCSMGSFPPLGVRIRYAANRPGFGRENLTSEDIFADNSCKMRRINQK